MSVAFVRGHTVNDDVYEFSHLCPGAACVIGAWLERKALRLEYESSDEDTENILDALDAGRTRRRSGA